MPPDGHPALSIGEVLTDHNTATSNDVDIYMYQAGAGSLTTHNKVRASTYDGIILQAGTAGNEVSHKSPSKILAPASVCTTLKTTRWMTTRSGQ